MYDLCILIYIKFIKVSQTVFFVRVQLGPVGRNLEILIYSAIALAGWIEKLMRNLLVYKCFFKPQDRNQSTLFRPIKLHSSSLRKILEALSLRSI